MKKIFSLLIIVGLVLFFVPNKILAAGGVYASGGGKVTVGDSFTVTVTASGATFDSLQGVISVSGPVSVTSFSAGSATWLPGKTPANGGQFVGITSATSSLRVATIKLRATAVGSGAVSVSGVKLASAGALVGDGAGSASYTISKALSLPAGPTVTSSSHPDQNAAYETTSIVLAWTKVAGVTGFGFLLDQVADTTPAAKADSADITITYPDKAIGTYYFHIRAQNADGWGGATHFKINIKEPDAKIDSTLSKPENIKIEKSSSFEQSLIDGTVTGIIISGTVEPSYTANITLIPTPTLPEGKILSVESDTSGNFSLLLDYPIVSGFHKLTVQGQKAKVLTPLSDEIIFEISHQKGGNINILTSDDQNPPKPITESAKEINLFGLNLYSLVAIGGALILLIVLGVILYLRKRRHKREISQ